jgi:hypothetical protein
MSDVRAWLEEVADQFMRDATATVSLPPGVRTLEHEMRIEVDPPGGIDWYGTVERPPLVFAAVLEDGSRIETTRE